MADTEKSNNTPRQGEEAPSSTPRAGPPSTSQSPKEAPSAVQTPRQKEEAPHRAASTKSQVSFAGEGFGRGGSMTSHQFMSYRQRSSMGFLLPSNFFQSQADIRTWGIEDLADPSVQPYDKDDPSLPRPFHVSLPGYGPRLCKYVISRASKEPRDPFLGPEITIFPPTWVPQWTPNPNFKAQRYGYNWEDNEAYKMDRLPYVNAEFDPISAQSTHMYNQCYPYTAYPYGVPRVA